MALWLWGRDETHWHAYWPLVAGEDMGKWKRAQRALIRHFGSDPACSDLSRVMRVWGSVNRKPDAGGGAVYSVWKNEDRKWTIDEVVAYYGLELDADMRSPRPSLWRGCVPSYLRDELKAEIEHKHVEVGERYNAGLLWSRDALAAGMEPTEVHELVQSAFLRWGYDSEKAERQAWNAQSGTVDKLSRGELSFDSRLRPAVDFPDDALMAEEEPLASGAAEAQAVSMGLADLATGLGEAGDQFTWLKENMSRVAKLGP